MSDPYYAEPSQEVLVRDMASDTPNPLMNAVVQAKPTVTTAQARIESVSAVLDAAYRNASMLKLTPEEAAALSEDFPDDAFSLGAGGDANLIYIEHAYLRERLNKVLGIGAATPIRRREWAEDFEYQKDGKMKQASRVYVDLVLMVRGCVVGEAIGDAVFYKGNANDSYSDSLEKAKSNAFRRCCKEFGVGLQVWKKGWCNEWKLRQSGRPRNTPMAPQTPPVAKPAPKPATTADVLPKMATEATRDWAWKEIMVAVNGDEPMVDIFLAHKEMCDDQGVWKLEYVPTSKPALANLIKQILAFGGITPQVSDEMPEDIANQIVPIPTKGSKRAEYLQNPQTIGSLYELAKTDEDARKRLWWIAKGWQPESWTGNNGRVNPPSKQDVDFRAQMDRFVEWHDAKEGETV